MVSTEMIVEMCEQALEYSVSAKLLRELNLLMHRYSNQLTVHARAWLKMLFLGIFLPLVQSVFAVFRGVFLAGLEVFSPLKILFSESADKQFEI